MEGSFDAGTSQELRLKEELLADAERQSLLAVHLKKDEEIQLSNDQETKNVLQYKEEKQELQSVDTMKCCMSEEAVLAGMYTNHKVVDELVLGPEFQHQPEASLVVLGWVLGDVDGCPKRAQEYSISEQQPQTKDSSVRLKTHEVPPGNMTETHTDTKTESVDPICDICGEMFVSKSDLKRHVSIHIHLPLHEEQNTHGEGLASNQITLQHLLRECSVTLERLPHREALDCNQQSTKTHADTEYESEETYKHSCREREPMCYICGVRFKMKSDLKEHLSLHINMPTIKQEEKNSSPTNPPRKLAIRDCSVTLERLPHVDALGYPRSAQYTTQQEYDNKEFDSKASMISICGLCGESFALKSDLRKHVYIHIHSENNEQCYDATYASDLRSSGAVSSSQNHQEQVLSDCYVKLERFRHQELLTKRYTNTHNAVRHQPSNLQQNNKLKIRKKGKLVCDVCGRTFMDKVSLIIHIKTHFLSLKTNVKKISNGTHSISSLPIASKDGHSGEKSYSCETCYGQFTILNEYKIHRRMHLGLIVYTCPVCHKKLTNSDRFESHKRIHTGERPYSCEVCKKTFIQKSHLNCHKRVHVGERPFGCEICDKHFMFRSILNVHIRICHTDSKPYSCDVCNKKFKISSHYKSHLRIHTGEKPYSCEICEKRFKEKHHLNFHVQLHTGKKPYYCETCDKSFALERYYDSHSCLAKKRYSCEICSKKFARPSGLTHHKRVHTREKPYACELCKERFLHKSKYKRHKLNHTGETRYTCELCDKKFILFRNFEAHKQTHTGEKPYSCEMCEMKFGQLNMLNSHKQFHASETYSCDYCKRSFSHKLRLISHLKKHMAKKSYVCRICNKQLVNAINYNSHKRVHMKNIRITCKICHQQFSQVGLYKIHKRVHLGKLIYSCELCDKKFIHKGSLEAHKRTHTGERPFACKLCDKRFTQSQYLAIHTRVHTGEKPYKCEICQRRFAQCGDWHKHKRVHTGEKPYSCEICSKRFPELRSLRNHRFVHSSKKPYPCDRCTAQFASKTGLKYHKERICKGK